jgi:type VI secretion system protein ImpA
MPLRNDILKPIPGENPSGKNIRRDPVWDKIKEARRQDDELPQGVWQVERKMADYGQVVKLAGEAIATQTKDLQLAAWLCEALIKRDGAAGLRDGLELCRGLLADFWETLYPPVEDGDLEDRLAPLEWVGKNLAPSLRNLDLTDAGHAYFQYKESRRIQYEDQAKSKEEKAAREKSLKEGRLAPEIFDKSFAETPKSFYANFEKALDASVQAMETLDAVSREKFGDQAPSYTPLKDAALEVRQVVHSLLQKKRETEPDPVEEKPPEPGPGVAGDAPEQAAAAAAASGGTFEAPLFAAGGGASGLEAIMAFRATAEPAGRREAVAGIVAAAAYLRKQEPFSPASYLMLRGLRWGELRAASDPAMLEAPPSDLRQQIKSLAMRNKWAELLDAAENIMALPCSRAWLDLQRLVVEACVALGDDYSNIAIAIRSGLRGLVRDLPHLIEATLTDDTPAANPATQEWLKELISEPSNAAPRPDPPKVPVMDNGRAPGWQKKFVDAHALALEAMRSGQSQKAVTILQREVERQLSGRGRFQRKLQLAQICIAAGKDTIAQPLLDDLAATIENHKLEDWEDREMVAGALTFLVQNSKKIQADAKAKQAMFERICRLDPVQALLI